MELRNERTFLFLADAAVEQDRPSGRVENEGLDGEHQSPPRRVQVVRVEQGTRRFDRSRRDPGQEAGDRELELVDVNYDVYRAVASTESHNLRDNEPEIFTLEQPLIQGFEQISPEQPDYCAHGEVGTKRDF